MIEQRFYSNLTKKLYNSKEEAEKAEDVVKKQTAVEQKKKEERSNRAKEVEEAYKKVLEDRKHYVDLKNKFIQDYGSFHMTYTDKEAEPTTLFDLFRYFDL